MPIFRKRVSIAAFAASIALSSCMVVPALASEAAGVATRPEAPATAPSLGKVAQASLAIGENSVPQNAPAWSETLVVDAATETGGDAYVELGGAMAAGDDVSSEAAAGGAGDEQSLPVSDEGVEAPAGGASDADTGDGADSDAVNVGSPDMEGAGDAADGAGGDTQGDQDAATPSGTTTAGEAISGTSNRHPDASTSSGAPTSGNVSSDSDTSDGAMGDGASDPGADVPGAPTNGEAGVGPVAGGSATEDGRPSSGSGETGSEAAGVPGAQPPSLEGALGWAERDGQTYYLGADGNPLTGLLRIDGAWYYLGPAAGGARATGEVALPNGTYHFDEATGAMAEAAGPATGEAGAPGKGGSADKDKDDSADAEKADASAAAPEADADKAAGRAGWVTDEATGARYYYDAGGQKLTGEQAIDGGWYYFDKDTGAMVTGFADIPTPSGTKTVFYDANGRMAYGEVSTNDNWYYFDRFDGRMALGITDIVTNGGAQKTVYYGDGGAMRYGEQNIFSAWYFFNTFDGHMARGITDMITSGGVSKTAYYANGGAYDGQMQYGEQAIDGGWYYFDTFSGAMARGITDITMDNGDRKTVYYADNGRMGYGEKNVNEGWYYFDEFDGHMVTGLRSIAMADGNAKTVLYGSDGRMQYGQQYVDGRWRYFDTFSGRMLSSEETRERVLSYIYEAIGTPDSETWKYQEEVREAGGNYCPDGPCYSFIWSCFRQAGMDRFLCDGLITGFPHESFDWMTAHGRTSMTPQRGSIVYFYYDDNSLSAGHSATHSEMVVEVGDGYIASIGAITGGIQKRYWDYSHIVGFGTPLY